jgi:hypothetical protein
MLNDVSNANAELSGVYVSIPAECCSSGSCWIMKNYTGGAKDRQATDCELTTVNRKSRGTYTVRVQSDITWTAHRDKFALQEPTRCTFPYKFIPINILYIFRID